MADFENTLAAPANYYDPKTMNSLILEYLQGQRKQQQQPQQFIGKFAPLGVAGELMKDIGNRMQLNRLIGQQNQLQQSQPDVSVPGALGNSSSSSLSSPVSSSPSLFSGNPLGGIGSAISNAFTGGSTSSSSTQGQSASGGQTGQQYPTMSDNSQLTPDFMAKVAHIESGGNPNLGWNHAGNRGLYQFGPEEERRYGLNSSNWNDPNAQHRALHMEMRDISRVLSSKGIDPTSENMYFVHQQGMGGGPALLSADPNTPAWQALLPSYKGNEVLAKSAINNNIYKGMPGYGKPVDQITAGEFRSGWASKFGSPALTNPQIATSPATSPDTTPSQSTAATSPVAAPGATLAQAPGQATPPASTAPAATTAPGQPNFEPYQAKPIPPTQADRQWAQQEAQRINSLKRINPAQFAAEADKFRTLMTTQDNRTMYGQQFTGNRWTGYQPVGPAPTEYYNEPETKIGDVAVPGRNFYRVYDKNGVPHLMPLTEIGQQSSTQSSTQSPPPASSGSPATPTPSTPTPAAPAPQTPAPPPGPKIATASGDIPLPSFASISPETAPSAPPSSKDQIKQMVSEAPDLRPNPPANLHDIRADLRYQDERKEYADSTKDYQTQYRKIAGETEDARNNVRSLKLAQNILNDPKVINGLAQEGRMTFEKALDLAGVKSGTDRAAITAVLKKLANGQMVSQIRESTLGQGTAVRETEAKAIREANYDPNNVTPGNLALMKVMERAEQRIVDGGDLANAYTKRFGRLDNGYHHLLAQYASEHPIFTDQELSDPNFLKNLMGTAGKEPEVTGPAGSNPPYQAALSKTQAGDFIPGPAFAGRGLPGGSPGQKLLGLGGAVTAGSIPGAVASRGPAILEALKGGTGHGIGDWAKGGAAFWTVEHLLDALWGSKGK